MITKTLAGLAVAAALVLGGGTAAGAADRYPVAPPECSVSPSTIPVGEAATVTCVWPDDSLDGRTAVFSVSGPAVGPGTLAEIRLGAVTGSAQVEKTIVGDTAAAVFTGPAQRVYDIRIAWDADGAGSTSAQVELPVTVTAATGTLPASGGEFPSIALWLGALLLGSGGIALAAGRARHRRG